MSSLSEKMEKLSLPELTVIWKALQTQRWGYGEMYSVEDGITMDDWALTIKSELEYRQNKQRAQQETHFTTCIELTGRLKDRPVHLPGGKTISRYIYFHEGKARIRFERNWYRVLPLGDPLDYQFTLADPLTPVERSQELG